MKVFIVVYETDTGGEEKTLFIMRKVYGKPAIAVRRWDGEVLSDVLVFATENYSRAADMFLSYSAQYNKILSTEEVMLQ